MSRLQRKVQRKVRLEKIREKLSESKAKRSKYHAKKVRQDEPTG